MSYWKQIIFTIYFLNGVTLMNSCSSSAPAVTGIQVRSQQLQSTYRRIPASQGLATSGCFSTLIPLLKEGPIYSDEGISAAVFDKRGLLNLTDYEQLQNSSYWQDIVTREGTTQRDEELGFMALAMIKKKHPEISEENLKDRFEVFKAFCGHSY